MKLVQIWDYIMRRKPIFLMMIGVLCLAFFGASFISGQQSGASLSQETTPTEKATFANDLLLRIGGQNSSFTMKISDEFSLATVSINESPLTHDAYVRILDANGQLVKGEYTEIRDTTPLAPKQKMTATDDSEETEGVAYFWIDAPKSYTIDLLPGYTIELHASTAEFYSTLDGKVAPAFRPTKEVERYIATENGLRKEGWSDAEEDKQIYELLRRHIVAMIEDYKSKVTDEVLNNRHLDVATKTQLILAYRSLRDEDQELYREFIDHLRIGGVPVITYHGKYEYLVGDVVNFAELVSATDGEDGEIEIADIMIDDQVDFSKAGEYIVTYSATDSDGNTTELAVTIRVNPIDVPTEDPEPGFTPGDHDPVTVLPGDDLNESEDFPVADLPNVPPTTNTIVAIGSGANVIDATDEAEVEVTINDEGTGTYEPTTEELDSTVETIRPSRDATSPDAGEKDAEAKGVTLTHILLIAGGILLIAGLIRFIFDHYVR